MTQNIIDNEEIISLHAHNYENECETQPQNENIPANDTQSNLDALQWDNTMFGPFEDPIESMHLWSLMIADQNECDRLTHMNNTNNLMHHIYFSVDESKIAPEVCQLIKVPNEPDLPIREQYPTTEEFVNNKVLFLCHLPIAAGSIKHSDPMLSLYPESEIPDVLVFKLHDTVDNDLDHFRITTNKKFEPKLQHQVRICEPHVADSFCTVTMDENYQMNPKDTDSKVHPSQVVAATLLPIKAFVGSTIDNDARLYFNFSYDESHCIELTLLDPGHTSVMAFFDSGATYNIVPEDTINHLPFFQNLKIIPETRIRHVRTGGGSIGIRGWISFPCFLGGHYLYLHAMVVSTECPFTIIIGRTGLECLDAIQLYGARQMALKVHTVNAYPIKRYVIPPKGNVRVSFQLDMTNAVAAAETRKKVIHGSTAVWFILNNPEPLCVTLFIFNGAFQILMENRHASKTLILEADQECAWIDIRSKGYLPRFIRQKHKQAGPRTAWTAYRHGADPSFEEQVTQKDIVQDQISLPKPIAILHTDPCTDKTKQKSTTLETGFSHPTKQSSALQVTENVNEPNTHPVPFPPVKKEEAESMDPFPCLDKNDPRRTMTNEQILTGKFSFKDSFATKEQQHDIIQLGVKHPSVFSIRDEIGVCNQYEVQLALKDYEEFFVRPYTVKQDHQEVLDREINRLETLGIISRSYTGYCSPFRLVPRKTGNLFRVIADFRYLNKRLAQVYSAFPLVRDVLKDLGTQAPQAITLIDLRDAYHTLRLTENSKRYCGATPYYGAFTYVYNRLPMGLKVSPTIFQQYILYVIESIPHKERYSVIMDDILVASGVDNHIEALEDLYVALARFGLKISPHKCQFMQTDFIYMGLKVLFINGRLHYTAMKDKCDGIRQLDAPKTAKDIRSFCGMVRFLSSFLPKLSEKLAPLFEATKGGRKHIRWTPECEKSFQEIKELLIKPPVLCLPTKDGHFTLESDTSIYAAGGALFQRDPHVRLIEEDTSSASEMEPIFREYGLLIGFHSKKLPE